MTRSAVGPDRLDREIQRLAQNIIERADLNWKVLCVRCTHLGRRIDRKVICHLQLEVRPGTEASIFVLEPDQKTDAETGWAGAIKGRIQANAARYNA